MLRDAVEMRGKRACKSLERLQTTAFGPTDPAFQSVPRDIDIRAITEDASTGWVTRICSGTGSFTCAESTAINNARALDVSYRYNGFGNISGATNAGLKSPTISAPIVESYSYDNLHRLIQTTGPTPVSYAYDAVGNILKKTDFSQNPVAGNAYVYGTRGGPCVFHAMPVTLSTASRSVIPRHGGQRFHGMAVGV